MATSATIWHRGWNHTPESVEGVGTMGLGGQFKQTAYFLFICRHRCYLQLCYSVAIFNPGGAT